MDEITPRPVAEVLPEQLYLTARLGEIDRGLGRLAARLGAPTPITQPMDALDRARELVADMQKQVAVRPLEASIAAQVAWLDAAEARLGADDGEPKLDLDRIALDRVLLGELLEGWRSRRN